MAVGQFGPEVVLNGNVLTAVAMPAKSVTVTNVDNSAATLYTDATGSTGLGTNVVATDSRGQLTFYAAPGFYKLTYSDSVGSQTLTVSVPNTAASDSASYAALASLVVRPETYGAVGDGATNDTAAFRLAVAALAGEEFGVLLLDSRKNYLVSTAPDTTKGGNAVIPLPNTGAGTIAIVGGGEMFEYGAQITATHTGLAYSGVNGCPSVIGGPTPEGSSNTFNAWNVVIDGVTVVVPGNPTICGIDLSMCLRARVTRTRIPSQSNASAPTSVYQFGYRQPDKLNHGDIIGDDIQVTGCYVGVVAGPHADIRQLTTKWCVVGIGVQDPDETASVDNHVVRVAYWQSEWTKYHLAGWTAATGVQSNTLGTPISIATFDIEDSASGWYQTVQHVLDANSKFTGSITYNKSVENVGPDPGALTISGAGQLRFTDLGAFPATYGVVPKASHYYSPAGIPGAGYPMTQNVMEASLFKLGKQATLYRIGVKVTGAGQAGSVIRLGVYRDEPLTGQPGALMVDAGTVAGDSTGVKEITLGTPEPLSAGRYWLVAVAQSCPVTPPQVQYLSGTGDENMGASSLTTLLGGNAVGQQIGSVSGALPATSATTDIAGVVTRIGVRFGS